MRGIDAGEQSALGPLVASLDEVAETFDELDGSIQATIERFDSPTELELVAVTATEVYFVWEGESVESGLDPRLFLRALSAGTSVNREAEQLELSGCATFEPPGGSPVDEGGS